MNAEETVNLCAEDTEIFAHAFGASQVTRKTEASYVVYEHPILPDAHPSGDFLARGACGTTQPENDCVA
ncbi:hypothetical protein JOF55_003777 [Haloactinomyces albus]|uniref:Uncharacterized protein n=1 Tax=Haloactinomyces albus TaxID=1352928 RepID=A0AAE4CNL3_9ACTN|nr:hypothetical protein [Haloactinomyces albus]